MNQVQVINPPVNVVQINIPKTNVIELDKDVIEVTTSNTTEIIQVIKENFLVQPIEQTTLVETVIAQGPMGPIGLPNSMMSYVAGDIIQGHKAVSILSQGNAFLADPTNVTYIGTIAGVSLNAANEGQNVTVQSFGPLEYEGWNWTPGNPVFVGLLGMLVQPQPVSTAFVQVIGYALSPTRLMINLQPYLTFGEQ